MGNLGEEYKKDNVYYAILQFEEGVRRRKRIQKHLKRTTAWDRVMKYVRRIHRKTGIGG